MDWVFLAGFALVQCLIVTEGKVCYMIHRQVDGQFKAVWGGDGEGPCTSYQMGVVMTTQGHSGISSQNEAKIFERCDAEGDEPTYQAQNVESTPACSDDMISSNCSCLPTCAEPYRCSSNCPLTDGCICPGESLKNGDGCVAHGDCPCYWTEQDILIPEGQSYTYGSCEKTVMCLNQRLTSSTDQMTSCSPNLGGTPGRRCSGTQADDSGCPIYDDCQSAYLDGHVEDGVYLIRSENWVALPFYVYCKMEDTDGYGWTVIQHRENGETDFYRDWSSYKNGFGSLDSEFWLGNEKIHHLTTQKDYQLRIDVTDGNYRMHDLYHTFRIGSESDDYRLQVTDVIEDVSSLQYADGNAFSTYDRDNDPCGYINCAEGHGGAWWYTWCHWPQSNSCRNFVATDGDRRCTRSNLNGRYGDANTGESIFSIYNGTTVCNIKYTMMMILPVV